MKLKAKNTSPIQTIPFLAIWAAAYIVGWMSAYFIYEIDNSLFAYGTLPHALLLTLVPGFFITLMQMYLAAPRLGIDQRQWFRYSMLGWLCSTFAYLALLHFTPGRYDVDVNLQIVVMHGTAPIVQWLSLLKNRHQNSWLWPLSAIISALVFTMIMLADPFVHTEGIAIMLSSGIQAIITGAIMLWLLNQNHPSQKLKQNDM